MTKSSRAAVFLDRDGTIIEDRGDLSQPSQVVLFPDTIPALKRLGESFDLFIVTNQSGVAKGTITMQDVALVNGHLTDQLAHYGIEFRAIYVCPHERKTGCACIKPNPFFMQKAARDFGIDLAHSFTIGDHPHDVIFAENAGATGIYVLTGHGIRHQNDLPQHTLVTSGIKEAVDQILRI
ncbi:MAG: HAD family hydrolase [Lentisphaerae bacterium]|nr:HAD family hydrolase [Lentisphaerota bacterium]